MVRSTLGLLVVAACRFSHGAFEPGDGGPRDGRPDAVDARVIDVPADAARDCLASWETGPLSLSAPVLLSELSAGSYDRDPFVTPDELTIYWSSKRTGDTVPHIYFATRAHWSEPFGNIMPATDLDSGTTDGKLSMSSDGKDAVLASNRSGNFDIWEATRASAQGAFGTPAQTELTANVDSSSDQLDPALSSDGLTLYWADSASGHQQVIVASRPSRTSSFVNTSVAVDNIMGVADPAISRDGRVLLYTLNTPTNEADIFYATRGSTSATFGVPAALTAIDTGFEEGDAFLSYDACDVFFASTQQSSGIYQIYVSHVQ